ncbi:MAG: putative phosphohexomutase / phosphatase [Thermoleophilaceae bacterium]|nr:putative phosphohexomutase / phosphatase [Thermoleophilaceae bacterium]
MRSLLFDLDGTLVDSRAVVERQWRRLCERLGLNFAEMLAVLHGVRSVDVIRAFAPGVDVEAEAAALDAAEQVDTAGLKVVPGAPAVLAGLPPGSWAIVTSGHRTLAQGRLRAVGLPVPDVMVCGDEVARGKPDPEGYLRALALLDAARAPAPPYAPDGIWVVEDSTAGVLAARAAGMRVVALRTPAYDPGLAPAELIAERLDEALATRLFSLDGASAA